MQESSAGAAEMAAPRDKAGLARAAMEWAAGTGYRWVQLDATALRGRDLDRSARRDVAVTLRRLGLGVSGWDLWVPPSHFKAGVDVDRAVAATVGALELAAEMRGLLEGSQAVLSIVLPADADSSVGTALRGACEQWGSAVADFAWPVQAGDRGGEGIGVGIDPASLIAAGADPVLECARLSAAPRAARWSDFSGGQRVMAGTGSLDIPAYEATLVARGLRCPVVVDLRGLRDQRRAALVLREKLS